MHNGKYHSAMRQQAAHTTYHHLLAAQQLNKSHITKKCKLSLNFNFLYFFFLTGEFSGEKSGQGNDTKEEATGPGRRKRKEIGKRNQISPEIPDRRWTSDILGLPLEAVYVYKHTNIWMKQKTISYFKAHSNKHIYMYRKNHNYVDKLTEYAACTKIVTTGLSSSHAPIICQTERVQTPVVA